MPRKVRTRRSRTAYNADHKEHLLSGLDFFAGGFGNGSNFREDAAAEAWDHLREELLAVHLLKSPCTRPWAWWLFEDHEPRLCVSPPPRGLEDEDDPDEPDDEEGDADGRRHFGVRSPYWDRDRNELLFESQAHYLRRHGLLTRAERVHLGRHPELLEPVAGWDAEKR
jgi:hypothetical protein